MQIFSKSSLFVVTVIFMAVASYMVAWFNIQNLHQEKALKATPVKAVDPVQMLISSNEESTPHAMPLTQGEVKQVLTAFDVVTLPNYENLQTWQKNSRQKPLKKGKLYIAIVIDDLGVVEDRSLKSIEELPKEVTFAFLPYGESTDTLSKKAYDKGHEIMIHLPMEAKISASGYIADPGEKALYVNMPLEEVERLTSQNLENLSDISVGVNNHMGSRFTEWAEGMQTVMHEVNKGGLMFLDSLTTSKSAAKTSAKNYPQMPFLRRDVFLDHEVETSKIIQALEKTEKVARTQGYAIAIGHPHIETTEVLRRWVRTLEDKNIQLVPITALIKE